MVFVNKRDDGFGRIDFSVCEYELRHELVYHLNLDIDMEEYGHDDEITNQVDKLLDDYLQHFDKEGWDFNKDLFDISFRSFRDDREVK